jgi:hypothetical protein
MCPHAHQWIAPSGYRADQRQETNHQRDNDLGGMEQITDLADL